MGMSPNYWKRLRKRQLRKSLAGVATKKARREAEAQEAVCVGTVTFEGKMFGGRHRLRCLYSESYSLDRYMVEIDGNHHRPQTRRGLMGMIVRRVWARGEEDGGGTA